MERRIAELPKLSAGPLPVDRVGVDEVLGARLQKLRKRHGISRDELAERVTISASTVARLERHPSGVSMGSLLAYLSGLEAGAEITALTLFGDLMLLAHDPSGRVCEEALPRDSPATAGLESAELDDTVLESAPAAEPHRPIPIRLQLNELVAATGPLRRPSVSDAEYEAVVDSLPNNADVWSGLLTSEHRLAFLKWILRKDDTEFDERENFANACQSYASQLCARYSTQSELSREELENMKKFAGIDATKARPQKKKFPLLIATHAGHAFNAALIGSDPAQWSHWAIFEPQTDGIAGGPDREDIRHQIRLNSHSRVVLSELIGFSRMTRTDGRRFNRYHESPQRIFIRSSDDTWRSFTEAVKQTRVFIDALFLSETGLQNVEHYTRIKPWKRRVADAAESMDRMDKDSRRRRLAAIGAWLNGRVVPPKGPIDRTELTPDIFESLTGVDGLADAIRRKVG